jgi:hypothetical protein
MGIEFIHYAILPSPVLVPALALGTHSAPLINRGFESLSLRHFYAYFLRIQPLKNTHVKRTL